MSTDLLERTTRDAAISNPTTVAPAGAPAAPTRTRKDSRWVVLLGVLGGAISFAGSWIPSFWGDEAASVLSAERSLPSLFAMLAHIDAVHGSYYLFLHGWISLFGASELSVRIPSAIAAGFAVAGTAKLAGMVFDPRTAIASGLICAVLPQLTHMGTETRSYAMTIAAGAWLTVLFVHTLATRPARLRNWLPYAIGLAAGIYLFLYFGLIVLAHGLTVVVRRFRAATTTWLMAVGIAVLLASPIIALAATQHGQVAFLAGRGYAMPKDIFVSQWFGNLSLAVAAWALILLALVTALRNRDRRVLLFVGWLLIPMSVILVVNALIVPTYNMRYVAFCLPAAAILIARGLNAFRYRWVTVIGIVLIAALASSSYLHERRPHAKDGGSDLSELAALIDEKAAAGDAVVFTTDTRPSERPRLALDLFPAEFAGIRDVALISPYYDNAWLWDQVAPVDSLGPALLSTDTVWDVEVRGTKRPANVTTLESFGYHLVTKFHTHRETVYELTRETP